MEKSYTTKEAFLRDLKEPEVYPGFMLWQASNIWQRLMKSDLKEFNTTYTQFIILTSIIYLSHRNEEINQRIIARHAKLDIMTVSDVMKTLVLKKLVERTINQKDRRHYSLKVTDEGSQLVYQIMYKVQLSDAQFFKALGEDEGRFNELLTKLIRGNFDKIFNTDI